ncbi:MAG TPA: ribosome maturation factor RimP [Acidimicrobiia bacterium]|jgi:ribosome maturation factor RimP
MTDVAAIRDAVEPVVSSLGLGLYDVEVTGSGRAKVVRVLVDREGGIDLDAVGVAAEAISPVLDGDRLSRVLPGPYSLEVSSPGLERPLRRPEHFGGAVGSTVSVKLSGGRVRGTLADADADGFDLTLDDGTTQRFSYDDVAQARTVFEWGTELETRKPRANQRTKVARR